MNKLFLIITFLFCGVTAMSQIYIPPNPTVYGSNNNRIKAIYSIGFPSKSDTTLNTTDDSPQIFYMTTDSTFWGYSKERGFFKLGSGGTCDTCIAYSTVSADSIHLYLIRQNGDTANIYSWVGEGGSGGGGSGGGIQSVQAGDGITVDNTDPSNPVVNAVLSSLTWQQSLINQGSTSFSTDNAVAFGGHSLEFDSVSSFIVNPIDRGGNLVVTPESSSISSVSPITGNIAFINVSNEGSPIVALGADSGLIQASAHKISMSANIIQIVNGLDSSTNDGSNVLFLKGDTLKRGSINPYTIKGKLTICGTGTDTLIFNGPQGGIWKSMDTSKVFVDPNIGVAHVKIVGSPTIITYSVLMNGSYYTASIPINGDISPNAGNITTSDSPIVGSQMTITIEDGMSGGKWVSNNTSRATVTPLNETQAIVNCISGGNVIIAYTVTTACGTSTANLPFFISTP